MAKRWENWAGIVRFKPREVIQPTSIGELARQIGAYGREGRRVRVTGSGHSFTPLVQSDDVLVSMEGLRGITGADEARGTVTVLGGTTLHELGPALHARGVAQENLGDIDVQTITGAISTGTHGTGTRFGIIPTQIAGLTLVTASGDVIECSPEREPEIFKAAQVSLGALGVIAAVTLRVVPAKRLRYQAHREALDTVLANLAPYRDEHAHFEFYWFPYTHATQVKFTDETTAPASRQSLWNDFNRVVLENGVFGLFSRMAKLAPPLCPVINKVSGWGISAVDTVAESYRIYATPREVRFAEMEYNLPQAECEAALREVDACVNARRFAVNFPLEVRFVQGDDIWLSPSYGRDSTYIAAHMYQGMPYKEYFAALEAIFVRHGGRPHWGKLHTRDAAYLANAYPRWADFQRVRAALDPQGIFLNDYLRDLFAITGERTSPPALP